MAPFPQVVNRIVTTNLLLTWLRQLFQKRAPRACHFWSSMDSGRIHHRPRDFLSGSIAPSLFPKFLTLRCLDLLDNFAISFSPHFDLIILFFDLDILHCPLLDEFVQHDNFLMQRALRVTLIVHHIAHPLLFLLGFVLQHLNKFYFDRTSAPCLRMLNENIEVFVIDIQSEQGIRMPKNSRKESEAEGPKLKVEEDLEANERAYRGSEEYKCGKEDCGKYYHSYTAFYNHCKKSHEGVFPPNSYYNGKIFEGPSKNRGRPRIKKTDAKNQVQIESMKTENELIEFFGTLQRKKKSDELIIYVPDPIAHLESAIGLASSWDSQYSRFYEQTSKLNEVITDNDLPDFYDPIEIHKFADKVDSFNFVSIYNYLVERVDLAQLHIEIHPANTISLLRKVLVIWLSRILSVGLLAEVIYSLAQIDNRVQSIKEVEYLCGKSGKMHILIDRYMDCLALKQPVEEEANSD